MRLPPRAVGAITVTNRRLSPPATRPWLTAEKKRSEGGPLGRCLKRTHALGGRGAPSGLP